MIMEQVRSTKERVATQEDYEIAKAINSAAKFIINNPSLANGRLVRDKETNTLYFNGIPCYEPVTLTSVVLQGCVKSRMEGPLLISITDFSSGTSINGEEHTFFFQSIIDAKLNVIVQTKTIIDGYLLIRE